jgi:hypothetical protein
MPVRQKCGGKAATAIAHTLMVIIWHVLHDGPEYRDWAATTSAATTPKNTPA